MSDPFEQQPGSSDFRREMDARCEKFEKAWIAGQSPRLEDHLLGVAEARYDQLIRELLTVELEYRRSPSGDALAEEKLIELHPRLATELGQAFEELRALWNQASGSRRSDRSTASLSG